MTKAQLEAFLEDYKALMEKHGLFVTYWCGDYEVEILDGSWENSARIIKTLRENTHVSD